MRPSLAKAVCGSRPARSWSSSSSAITGALRRAMCGFLPSHRHGPHTKFPTGPAFAAGRCREWSNLHGMRHRVVARDPQAEGFVVLARRWVVERSFGWLSHWGGLARDRAGRLDVSAARLAVVGILSGFEALLNPRPVRAPTQ